MSQIHVIVTCYNYGRFLRECVESVLQQSHQDLRVLIIDDASTDDTPAICAELSARDPRVEVRRHHENCGHIATYNEAIRLAEGEYMLLLSADDFLLPGCLRRAISVLDARSEIGMVYGDFVTYRAGDTLPDMSEGEALSSVESLDSASFIETLSIGNCVRTPTVIVRTRLQKRLGGYRVELPHSGDLEMWIRFALHSKVARLHTLQAAYRYHGSNMSLGYNEFADFEQCRDAFRAQYPTFRDNLPNGSVLEARIRRRFASKAVSLSKRAFFQRDFMLSLRLLALSLCDKFAASILLLRDRMLSQRFPEARTPIQS
jgi:glycosyltransferase involved in cell wall biosynthesis